MEDKDSHLCYPPAPATLRYAASKHSSFIKLSLLLFSDGSLCHNRWLLNPDLRMFVFRRAGNTETCFQLPSQLTEEQNWCWGNTKLMEFVSIKNLPCLWDDGQWVESHQKWALRSLIIRFVHTQHQQANRLVVQDKATFLRPGTCSILQTAWPTFQKGWEQIVHCC